MICYMPFTHIADNHLKRIVAALGALTVYIPAESMAPAHMCAGADQGALDLRQPAGVDAEKLLGAIREFKAWAELHQGNITELAEFLKSTQGQPPLVSDTDPTQISNQIRQFGQTRAGGTADPVFRSALFLAMAHEYDQQQLEVDQGLGSVHAKEKAMFSKMDNDIESLSGGSTRDDGASGASGGHDPGLYMTVLRTESWAEMVRGENPAASLYVTSSAAVFEHLLDVLPETRALLDWDLHTTAQDGPKLISKRQEVLQTLAYAEDPWEIPLDNPPSETASGGEFRLNVHALAGCSPQAFPAKLLTPRYPLDLSPTEKQGPKNTLIGLIAPQ